MPMTFGEALTSLLKERGMSATAVAEELGFKSRTAFFRILHDESRMPAIQSCFEEAKKSKMLALTPEQIDLLREAMRVNEIGKQAYSINSVLHRMIYPAAADDNMHQEISIEGLSDGQTLVDLLSLIRKKKKITIVIMGRCSKYIMDHLHRLTKEADIRKIVHLFALDEEDAEDIKVFAEMSDIIFSSAYSVYYLNETGVGMKNWWLRSGVILFSFEEENEERRAFQLTWLRKGWYLFSEDDQEKLKGFWNSMLRNVKDRMIPFKLESEQKIQPGIQPYVELTRSYQKIEQNREMYTIKPDFPMNCVPVEIIAPPVIEAFSQIYPEKAQNFTEQISHLYDIHKARVTNLYQKKKATHIVLNIEAMRRFAKTGSRSDHFFSTRPYTPKERVQVLTLLRDHAQAQSNFNIWMCQNPDIVSDRELTIYDGYGVALVKGDTSWRLDQDHQEILIESPMLAQYFKSYFMSDVLGKSVMTKEESIVLLDELIAVAKESEFSTET